VSDLEHAAAGPAAPAALDDVRVTSVLAVLRGASIESAARRSDVDPALLARWVGAFVTAGVSSVVHRPDPLVALQRDRLLSAVAAEIRGPLATARATALRLQADVVATDPRAAQLELLTRTLDQLDERVGDASLLVATAIGGIAVHRERVTVASLAAAVGIGTVHGKDPAYVVEVDPDLFARALRDVWAAAARPPHPRYRRLYVRCVGPWVELRVLRPGDPLDHDLLHALFEPFEHDRDDTGVTVGLYLARALVVAHGGTLGVDQDDAGGAFWIRVPALPVVHPPRLGGRLDALSAATDPATSSTTSTTASSTVSTRTTTAAGHPDDRPAPEENPMTFRLACGDVMPGCHSRFEDSSRDALLGQVAAHAAADHGITTITPDILAAVQSKITVG
jgi:signal transduction histidine kinase/predicted small metal-binding protein